MPPKRINTANATFTHPEHYAYSCMANRYCIEPEAGFKVVRFGLINGAGILIDWLGCILPEDRLLLQKENLVQYSDKIGLPKKKIPSWRPPALEPKRDYQMLPVIDFVHASNWDNAYAEMCLWAYSQGGFSDSIKNQKAENLQIRPSGIAVIRSSLDLQRGFVSELFEGDE